MNPIFEVTIKTLIHGGSGIGRLADGRVIFVPFTLPGERVKVRIREEKKGFVKAELVEVLQPSPERISPRCVHYGVCGGCHYQHIPYDLQVNHKKAILIEQLQRLGGVENPPVTQAVKSSEIWNYRNALQFHLSNKGKLGFERSGSQNTLEIQECHLPCSLLNEFWPKLDFESVAEIDRVELRQGDDDEILLVLYSQNPTRPDFETELPISAVHISPQGAIALAGHDHLKMNILDKRLRVTAGSFFQVNHIVTEQMVSLLLNNIDLKQDMAVLDLYCGVGLFSAFLAPQVSRCMGVEVSPTACRDYAFNLDEFDNVELYEGAAEEILPMLEIKPDLAVVDPPRSGLDRRALEALIKMSPRNLAYISCDPATLARDAKRLIEAGFALDETILLDMFPQTYHIESINFFYHQKNIV